MATAEAHFLEVFEFTASEREDVRKMALQGLAQHSRDNNELNKFLASHESAVTSLMSFLNVKSIAVLGDVLTVFTNCGADSSCAELFAKQKIVSRTMRLLDGLEASDHNAAASLKELALIMLNNITATHITAVDDLLQVEDEDLKGFYLSKLMTIYLRQSPDAPRDVRKWILQTVLNVTRAPEGQMCVVQDDDCLSTLRDVLLEGSEVHRLLAGQIFRNTGMNKESHKALGNLETLKLVTGVVSRLHQGQEPVEAIQILLVEFIAAMLQSEQGMQALEEINTKKYLVEGMAGDTPTISGDVAVFVKDHILPFLDDIQDAYVVQGDE